MAQTQACWPPTLTTDPEILGYLTDINKINYSRDIGRSFHLGGNIYHQYGDTFCKNSKGDFVGVVCCTTSKVVDQSKPLQSSYLAIDSNGLVMPLLSLNDEEIAYQKNNPGNRPTLWAFGGVVEVGNGIGLLWYEKGIDHNPGSGQPQTYECLGIGIAKVAIERSSGQPTTERIPGLLFQQNEPHFGSAFLDNGYIYLYGQISGDCKIALTRVPPDSATDRSKYQFWNGSGWCTNTSDCAPAYADLPQGQVLRSSFFGTAYPYLFVGVSKYGDSKIRVGRAKAPEGPWDIYVVGTAKGINYPNDYMYCIFPHPWAFADKDGKLMVTWSEHWPGGVVAAKLSFKLDAQAAKQGL
ncbi:uncharacterized protein KY384_001487 [Bacidia gigantensis]|uniref:uncharacterized protein n=1 Tax=Bacidia gigantensis TaxID=2732470 RepID=UPI001D048AF8|nr:uncharacterized protein KY384_001487 [Bacidia gigantensis]KAG8533746.1 hypothetical protein KY384_001487 [Bacidia gigantensis]